MILNPYFWLGLIVALLIIFGSGYHNGYKHANDQAEALKLQAVAKVREAAIEQALRDQQTAQNYENVREIVRIQYVTLKEKAHANIENNADYDNCGLDADGLRLYNARPGAAKDTASGFDDYLPGFAGSAKRQTINDSGEQPGAIANVLRLPGPTQSIIEVGGAIGGTGTAETLALVDSTQ